MLAVEGDLSFLYSTLLLLLLLFVRTCVFKKTSLTI